MTSQNLAVRRCSWCAGMQGRRWGAVPAMASRQPWPQGGQRGLLFVPWREAPIFQGNDLGARHCWDPPLPHISALLGGVERVLPHTPRRLGRSGRGVLRLPGTCGSPNRNLSPHAPTATWRRRAHGHASLLTPLAPHPGRPPRLIHSLPLPRPPASSRPLLCQGTAFCGRCRAWPCLSGPRRHPGLEGWGFFFWASCVCSEGVCCRRVLRVNETWQTEGQEKAQGSWASTLPRAQLSQGVLPSGSVKMLRDSNPTTHTPGSSRSWGHPSSPQASTQQARREQDKPAQGVKREGPEQACDRERRRLWSHAAVGQGPGQCPQLQDRAHQDGRDTGPPLRAGRSGLSDPGQWECG